MQPAYAQKQTAARRWSGARLDRNADLRERVLVLLSQGWSPEQVVGRLKREEGRTVIGCETIYRFIYAQLNRTKDGSWRHYLPRAKSKRGRRRKRGGSPALLIKHRVPVHERPAEALDRRQPGHWEADFMLFSAYGQSVLVLHERTSRLTTFVRTTNRKAEPTAHLLSQLLEPLPRDLKLTLTFDNGTEFAEHHRLDHRHLLLRPACALAEGRCRKRRRRLSPLPAKTNSISRQPRPGASSPRPPAPTTTPLEDAWTSRPRSLVFSKALHLADENPHTGFQPWR